MPGRDTNTGAKRAREARAALGLDPVAPLGCVLATVEERAGVPVVVARLPAGVAGCCWREGDRVLLWVNGDHVPARQRFTLAHEFGHVRCGHEAKAPIVDSVAVLGGLTQDPREVQANAFAAELLAPRPGVEALVDGDPGLEDVVRIAAHFGISALAAVYRLGTLGLSTRVERLEDEVAEGFHRRVRDDLALPELRDGLAEIDALPRLPAALAGSALAAALAGESSVAAAAGAAGAAPGALGDGLEMIGG
jgi:Zn-dependent peptidase ImmA (M78 family)